MKKNSKVTLPQSMKVMKYKFDYKCGPPLLNCILKQKKLRYFYRGINVDHPSLPVQVNDSRSLR